MRNIFLWLMLLVFLGYALPGLSQHNSTVKTTGTKSLRKEATKTFARRPFEINELKGLLQEAGSPFKKAAILYEIANAYLGRFKIDSSLYFSEELKKISTQNQFIQGIGKYHLLKAGSYFLRNAGRDAMLELDTAIRIFETERANLYLGLSYRLKARQLGMYNDNAGAQQYYRKAITFIRQAGDKIYLQRTLHDFGRNFFFTYQTDSAAIYLTQALKMAEEMNSSPKIFNTASMLGAVHLLAGNLPEARAVLKYAIANRPPEADKVQLRGAWANYSETLILNGQYAEAKIALKEHSKLSEMLGDITGTINEKKLNGLLLYKLGQNREALLLLREAYEQKEKLGDFDFDIRTIALYLGQCELNEGLTGAAITHFQHARQLAGKYNSIITEMEADILLARAYQQEKDIDSAYHYFKVYAAIKDSIISSEKNRTVLELNEKYQAEKKEFSIRELQKEKEIFSYQLILKNKTIETQQLEHAQNSQQLALAMQQQEVSRLKASEQLLALQNKDIEFLQKQKELEQAQKESRLQHSLAAKENQNKKLLYGIIIAGVLAGCYIIFRYRQTEKMRKKLAISLTELKQAQEQLVLAEKEKEAENIRLRISRDIHDEVGATLSGVVLFSEIAKQKMGERNVKDAGEYLSHISSSSKEMVEKMSDIIWTINPKNDSFEKILFKLRSYGTQFCSGKNIQLHFNVEESLFQHSLSMQTRKNIYLLIKEALNNAVKYSAAGNIHFSIKSRHPFLDIEIMDDGKGFNMQEQQQTGNGIGNMQARAKELGSHLSIETRLGKGTRISLQMQFHPIGVSTS